MAQNPGEFLLAFPTRAFHEIYPKCHIYGKPGILAFPFRAVLGTLHVAGRKVRGHRDRATYRTDG